MSDSGNGIGQKLMEAGLSSMKAGADEVKTSITTAIGQVTGQEELKTDQEIQNIEAQDKVDSGKRIQEIQQELAAQKRRHFQEVASWGTPTEAANQPQQSGPETPQSQHPSAQRPTSLQQTRPLSVQQAVGKSEQGRNFKG